MKMKIKYLWNQILVRNLDIVVHNMGFGGKTKEAVFWCISTFVGQFPGPGPGWWCGREECFFLTPWPGQDWPAWAKPPPAKRLPIIFIIPIISRLRRDLTWPGDEDITYYWATPIRRTKHRDNIVTSRFQFPLVQIYGETISNKRCQRLNQLKHRECCGMDATCFLYTGAHRCKLHTGELSKVKLIKEAAEVCVRQVRQHSWESRTVK